MTTHRILAVVDPATDGGACKKLLTYYDVKCAQTLRPTLQLIATFDPELIVIDIDANTLGKTRRITQAAKAHFRRPFVILIKSGRASPRDIPYYDKHLSRPFVFKRLKDAIDKLLDSRTDYVITAPPFTLDRRTHVLVGPKGKVRLSPKLFKLMDKFLSCPGETVSQMALMKEIWETTILRDIRTLHVHIHWLRKIVEEDIDDPHFLKTAARNKGYYLDVMGAPVIGGEPIFLE